MIPWVKVTDGSPEAETENCSFDCLITNGDYISFGYKYLNKLNDDDSNGWFDSVSRVNRYDVTHFAIAELPK